MDIRSFLVLVVTTVASGYLLPQNQFEGPGPEVFIKIDPKDDFEWIKFKKTFNKTYSGVWEDGARRLKWEENVKLVNTHNEEFLRGDHSFWLRIQEHSDMTLKEFMDTRTGLILPREGKEQYPPALEEVDPSVASSVDWTSYGYVTPIQNQGSCGSCWAFSAAGAIEGQNKKKKGSLPTLSEQNLVDCTLNNWGCQGGWMNTAFQYVKNQGGIAGDSCYPYVGVQNGCKYSSSCKASYDNGYVNIGKSEASLQTAVGNEGPIAFACDVNSNMFFQYGGGVYDNPSCSQYSPNHAMLIVGYGSSSGIPFWKVKNSWGTWWGENGYVKMRRNANNQCGVANWASYPIL